MLELMSSVDGVCLHAEDRESDFDPETLSATELQAGDDEIARPVALSHAVLKTSRYEEMVQWYMTVLGCRIRFRTDRVAFLSYDDAPYRIVVVDEQDLVSPGDTFGYDHCAFEYPTMEDLAISTYARLAEHGIVPYWSVNHGMTTSMYYADPDLNRIELQVDNFKTKAECWRYITGPDFARNPIGADLNPDDLVAMVKGGASYDEMHHRAIGPRTTPIPSPSRVLRHAAV